MAKFLRVLPCLVLLLGLAVPAQAQIYSWRDANGNLVLSDRPPAGRVRTFAVERVAAIRVTKPPLRGYRNAYDDLIEHYAAEQGLRPDLVRAVIQVESGYNSRAVSAKGAMGLMQLMPTTATEFGVFDPFNVAENIRGGTAYLRQLLEKYGDNEELALAAYNAGPRTVDRYGSQVPPYRETRDYVRKIREATDVNTSSRVRFIYKTIEIINGRPVPRYSDVRPTSGHYEIIPTPR